MDSLLHGALEIFVEEKGDTIHVRLQGRSDSRKPSDALTPFFDAILEQGVEKLIVDFRELEYMNSTSMLPIIKLLYQLHQKKIESEFVYDGNLKWQVVTFSVLGKLISGRKIENVKIRFT